MEWVDSVYLPLMVERRRRSNGWGCGLAELAGSGGGFHQVVLQVLRGAITLLRVLLAASTVHKVLVLRNHMRRTYGGH